jgi:hypothetical protein
MGGQHLGATHDQAVFGLVDDAEMSKCAVLLVRPLRAIALRIDDGMSQEQVAVAAILVVGPHVARELFAALPEEVGALGPGHQHGVEVIGRATDHAEGGVCPDLHRFATLHDVGEAARDHERRTGNSALADIGHDLAVFRPCLQVVERRDGFDWAAKHRVGGDVVDASARDPDLARMSPQPLDELASAARRHSRPL